MIGSALACVLWGYFLYQGVIDPLGGIKTLWPLFGIANQMLAAIALTLCTVVLFKMKRERYAWVTIVPTVWLVVCTVTAGLAEGVQPEPGRRLRRPRAEVRQRDGGRHRCWRRPRRWTRWAAIVFNDYVDADAGGRCSRRMVVIMVVYGVIHCRQGAGHAADHHDRGRRPAGWRAAMTETLAQHGRGWSASG